MIINVNVLCLLWTGIKEVGGYKNSLCFLTVNWRCEQFLITISLLTDWRQWSALDSDDVTYCKTCYFLCILILQFCNVEISLFFSFSVFTFSQTSTGICHAFDGQTEFSWVFNLVILSNCPTFHAHKIAWFTVCVKVAVCKMTASAYCRLLIW